MLVTLVFALLVLLIWLAGRFEASQIQERLERDANEASSDIRSALNRNIQNLQALQTNLSVDRLTPAQAALWQQEALTLLRKHREIVRLEWRSMQLQPLRFVDTPYGDALFSRMHRESAQSDVVLACGVARRASAPGYSGSYFLPLDNGLGLELMEMCLPLLSEGKPNGYIVVTYSLLGLLSEMVGPVLLRGQDLSLTEADGTRLAMLSGAARRGTRMFSAPQLLDLSGNTMVLRLDNWRSAPDLFPNVLTALVTLMSVALVSVLWLLGKDIGRRLKAERDLAEALAFRKAMEDSLLTGLRARDLSGCITYVNPAFCQMTGFSQAELVGVTSPMPYWPPEFAHEYEQRQSVRFAGHVPSRQGHESVFIRKDGVRFPVLIMEAPLINVLGEQTGWMSAVLNITDQRRMEETTRASLERLQASARLASVGEMASLLAHELNQPLAAISSYATGSLNMLHTHATLASADMEHAMQGISTQAERAGKIIKSVHDFVRRRERAHETIQPQALLDAVMPLVSLQARKGGVRVQVHCPREIPMVSCDRTMVEQVLLNLSRNAVQAMEHCALAQRVLELGVTWKPMADSGRSGWLEFTVTDHGTGIDAAVAEQLFTPFFTTKAEGMGLGLSLCRTIVEQHGGVLNFEPHIPAGTRFRFTLPIFENPPI